jgi:tetratricopeptide (TPR) repeat protein
MRSSIKSALADAFAAYADGRPGVAEPLCRAVLDLDPQLSDAWHLLGLIALDAGDGEAAVDFLERAVGLQAAFAPYHVNLATAYQVVGRIARAEVILRKALALQDDFPEAHHNLGNLLRTIGRTGDAAVCFERAVALKPDYAEALSNLGQLRMDAHDSADALALFRRALAARPGYASALSGCCSALLILGRVVEAIEMGRLAVVADPNDAAAHYNLGNAYMATLMPGEAESSYRRALLIDSGFADAQVNLGAALQAMGRHDAAIAAFDRTLELSPDMPDAHWNKAISLLASERYAEGWALYEWRWRAVDGLDLPHIPRPMWDGADLSGKTILILCEQGYGDTLQFMRYLPTVRALGGRIVLECAPPLELLLAAQETVAEVILHGERRPAFDCWLPMMSLARVLGPELPLLPAAGPYLAPPDAISDARVNRRAVDRLSVGLVWRGSLTNVRGRFRSCTLADFDPVLAVDDAAFFSLQTELSDADRNALAASPIVDLGSGFGDFADSARAVAALDLIVSVDTAMAHLAGALARPVWTVLSAMPDWRWLTGRDDSPWYPTMRLFRQRTVAMWSDVFAEVAVALKLQVARHGAAGSGIAGIEERRI